LSKGFWRCFEVAALCSILALAAYLRLTNAVDNPGWYTDEGTHLDIAQNLADGRVQYLAINQSTLLFAKLPLFELLLAGLLRVFGGGIGTLRAFTGTLGFVTVGLLYWVVRRTQRGRDPALPLLSALMLAIYPQAVIYSRFGFSYNLLAPLVLVMILGCWEYLCTARRPWLVLAALAIGLGGVSDLWMFVMAVPTALVVLRRNWRDLLWSLPLIAVPFSLYAGVMLVTVPEPFLFDLGFTIFRLNAFSVWAQLQTLATNYAVLVFQEAWIGLSLVGLFLLRPIRLRRLSLLMFLLPITILGRTVALYSLGFYYTIPLLPVVGLGLGALLRYGVPHVWHTIHAVVATYGSPGTRLACTCVGLVALLVAVAPFATSLSLTVEQVKSGFRTQIDPFLLEPEHTRQVAEFINDHTTDDSLVIASPTLVWLLQSNAADPQLAIAATGQPTPGLPRDIPADRFAFDPSYTQAQFIVDDNLGRAMAGSIPGTAEMARQLETWSLVLTAGEIRVYCNPAYCNE
jgi:hypothetical protein